MFNTLNYLLFCKWTKFKNAKKISKVHMWIYYNPLTSQNSSPIGMSLSGIIFNLTSSLTNEWTPPLNNLLKFIKQYWRSSSISISITNQLLFLCRRIIPYNSTWHECMYSTWSDYFLNTLHKINILCLQSLQDFIIWIILIKIILNPWTFRQIR